MKIRHFLRVFNLAMMDLREKSSTNRVSWDFMVIEW